MIPRIFASIVDKLVTKAGYGQDVLRVCRIWFELLPQVRDVQADIVVLILVLVAPDFAQQRLRWHEPTRVRREMVEQPVFSCRQMHRLSAEQDLATIEVDAQVLVDLDKRLGQLGWLLRTPQRFDAQLLSIDGAGVHDGVFLAGVVAALLR